MCGGSPHASASTRRSSVSSSRSSPSPGGAGILLYFALWVYGEGWRTWAAAALIAAAGAMLLLALGLSSTAVVGATLLVAGFATVVIRGGSLRPGGSLPILGVTLLLAGAVIFLGTNGKSGPFIVPGAVVGALVLVVGPGSGS